MLVCAALDGENKLVRHLPNFMVVFQNHRVIPLFEATLPPPASRTPPPTAPGAPTGAAPGRSGAVQRRQIEVEQVKVKGPNQWPSKPPHLKPLMLKWLQEMEERAEVPGEAKLVHYPPAEGGMGDSEGLEFLDANGQWIPATPVPNSLVCNLGEVVQLLTAGVYPATVHRVLQPKTAGSSKGKELVRGRPGQTLIMAGEAAAKGTMGIFIVFVLSRALHPMVIDYSKEDGKMLYSKNSPAIMSQLLFMLFVNFLAWQEEGMKGVKACWQIPKGASIFIVIGLWYAFGDFLEMLSMGAMNGGLYQLLLQSKLLITAVMMKQLKGTTQSDLQWNVLIAATLAISAFVMVDSGSSDGESGIPLMGVVMVLFKVGVSCYAAVLSDAKLKGFSNMSMSAKLSLMSLSRVIASVGIAAVMEPSVQPSYEWSAAGFFDHWTLATWVVTLSFTSKITLYLLKSLDGIQKNVGEALAVIVIFLGQIAAGSSVFNLCAFLLACLVVILVKSKAADAVKAVTPATAPKVVDISNTSPA
eukprot:g27742.t1